MGCPKTQGQRVSQSREIIEKNNLQFMKTYFTLNSFSNVRLNSESG